MKPQLNITVISDLHCTHSSKDKTKEGVALNSTILYSDQLRGDSPLHPIVAFLNEYDKNSALLKSDLLLCPGDITDKVDPQGYLTGWSFLEEIKETIGADKLFATIGNHDVDSRRSIKNQQPFDICKSIKKNYPIADQNLREQFWNDHFCLYEDDKYILLIFNSAYTHISSGDAMNSAIQRGIIGKMAEKLAGFRKSKIKIALCHHHPINHANVTGPDSDVIEHGTEFLDLLHSENFSLVIHGHKHEIKIRYYQSILVFCAGSFSSTQNLRETQSENVFHRIEYNSATKGIIKTWTFGSVNGWVHKGTSVFPASCGFGYHTDIQSLADRVNDWFKNQSNSSNDTYSNLVTGVPDVQFLLPDQMDKLEAILNNQFQISFTYNKNGIITQISKVLQ
jgi:predicted phosphodiesterase